MKSLRLKTVFIILATPLLLSGCFEVRETVYLTWRSSDTSTTMTVNYMTKQSSDRGWVYYDTESHSRGDISSYRNHAFADSESFLDEENKFHHIELTGLEPDTTYYFVTGDPTNGYSFERKFKTLPNDGSPVRIAQGGDIGTSSTAMRVSDQIAKSGAMAVLIGGDIAYANGDTKKGARWNDWFSSVSEHLVTPDGYLLPLIIAIGNHEVNKGLGGSKASFSTKAPFFSAFFRQNESKTYFARELGPHGILFVLDSGHISHWGSDQKVWMQESFQEYEAVPNKMAMYHVPLYPSHRDYAGTPSAMGRGFWIDIFDHYNLSVAFENHDHMYKRTYMMRDDRKVESDGVVYVGDGCWGKGARSLNSDNSWYLDRAEAKVHFWLADIREDALELRAVDSKGRVFDHFLIKGGRTHELLNKSKLISELRVGN